MMNTGELIKKLRKEKGMTQEELGKLLGKNRAAINKMESGATVNFKRDTLLKLSEIFNITVTDLLQSDKPKPTHKRIPVLGKVAAGEPIEQVEDIIGYEEIPFSLAETATYFALKIRGDSMEPRMYDGDVVIVRQQECAENGDIVIASVNGKDATCKRFRKTDSGIMLISLNSKYDPFVFSPEQVESLPIRILGKVVEMRCRF